VPINDVLRLHGNCGLVLNDVINAPGFMAKVEVDGTRAA